MHIFVLAVALLLPAVAFAGEVRTGPDAYGDWRGDAPGVARRILPADMPPPFATRSHARSSGIVQRPFRAAPVAPPGFAVTLFASGLRVPRVLRAAPDGGIFLAETTTGRPCAHAGAAHASAATAISEIHPDRRMPPSHANVILMRLSRRGAPRYTA